MKDYPIGPIPGEGNPIDQIANEKYPIGQITENHYPLQLRESIYKPKVLYFKGTLPDKDSIGIAMVGTRRPGGSAEELCRRLVQSLRGTKAVVVSGLAQGIDSYCHEAALDAGIPTLAVLAQGLDTEIGGSRGDTAMRILENGGALLSQFEPRECAYKGNFIARNKIISGLSRGTVIVQSKSKGGALLTGEFTRKEGKPLYAVPGDFDSEVACGPNLLLDRGLAKAIFRPESMAQILGIPVEQGITLRQVQDSGCNLGKDAQTLFQKMRGFRKNITELESEWDFGTNRLLTILTELEIAGLVHTEDNFMFHFDGGV